MRMVQPTYPIEYYLYINHKYEVLERDIGETTARGEHWGKLLGKEASLEAAYAIAEWVIETHPETDYSGGIKVSETATDKKRYDNLIGTYENDMYAYEGMFGL